MDWYEQNIEYPIRDTIKALRNNGINTFCSCGHEMYIECETYDAEADLNTIYNVLIELGYDTYYAQVHDNIKNGYRNRYIEIKL